LSPGVGVWMGLEFGEGMYIAKLANGMPLGGDLESRRGEKVCKIRYPLIKGGRKSGGGFKNNSSFNKDGDFRCLRKGGGGGGCNGKTVENAVEAGFSRGN